MANTIQQNDLGQDNTQQAGNQQQQQVGIFSPTSGNGQSPTGGQGSGSSGGSTAVAGGSAAAPATNPNQQKGSGYTNIQKVLQANQGNQLGQAVGNGIQGVGQQASQNLQNQQQQFQQGTSQNQFNTGANQQLVQNVLQNPTQYVSGQPGSQSLSGPQASQFQQLMSGQYQGPQGLNNTQQLQSQAADVNQLNQAIGSQGGRTGLLQRFVGNPQYTQGQQGLDSLLLGQQNNQQALGQARTATAGLSPQIQNAITGAQAQGQQAASQAQQFGQGVQNQFGQTVTGLNNQFQNQATQAQNASNAQYQQAIKDFQSGNISQQEANLLGVTPGEQVTGNVLQGIGSYLTQNPLQATAQNDINQQQYAQLAALQQLGGQNAPTSAQNILGQYNQGQVGQFAAAPTINADTTGFNNALQNSLGNYQSQIASPLASYQQAQKIHDIWYSTDPALYTQGAKEAAIRQFAPGALGSANSDNEIAWANANLATDQAAYNNALASANAAVGGLQNLNITPEQAAQQSAYPSIANTVGSS